MFPIEKYNQLPYQKSQKIQKSSSKNICFFLGTHSAEEFQKLAGCLDENSVISKYSRTHAKMTPQEAEKRIFDMINFEITPEFQTLTFIYSGHGWQNGLCINQQILEYKTLISLIIEDLKQIQNCQIQTVRIILDCCHAGGIYSEIINYLYSQKPTQSLLQIKLITASELNGYTIGFGNSEIHQISPFFQFFLIDKGSYIQNQKYSIIQKEKGVFVFQYGPLNKNGKYEKQSVAKRMIFNKDQKTSKWKMTEK